MSARRNVRWTVGDVSARGWEALRLSVHCAVRLFGSEAAYVICVNTVPLERARALAGKIPDGVRWADVGAADIPEFLRPHLDAAMGEGVGWKLLPLRMFPDRHELALDNDCILWERPAALTAWMEADDRTLLAADMTRSLGVFQDTPMMPGVINSGIRGLPPKFDLGEALRLTLREKSAETSQPVQLESELDEQGLQAVALQRDTPALVVETREVSICSPFWPRDPELGTCGAHFVGLNSRYIPWDYYDRPGSVVRREHWDQHRPELYRRAGLPLRQALPMNEPE